jgi:hypothetical protein
MNSKILKPSILAVFLSFAVVAFFFSGGNTVAQNKQIAILENVRDYKTWTQVTKPPQNSAAQPITFVIDGTEVKGNFSEFG